MFTVSKIFHVPLDRFELNSQKVGCTSTTESLLVSPVRNVTTTYPAYKHKNGYNSYIGYLCWGNVSCGSSWDITNTYLRAHWLCKIFKKKKIPLNLTINSIWLLTKHLMNLQTDFSKTFSIQYSHWVYVYNWLHFGVNQIQDVCTNTKNGFNLVNFTDIELNVGKVAEYHPKT